MSKKMNFRTHINVGLRITFWITGILVFSAGIACCLWMLFSKITVKQFFYNETSNLDYSVCLKENEYFEQCLGKDRQYVANIIDYVNAEFKYVLNSSDVFDYNYKYHITAKIVATEKGDSSKILYTNEEIILTEKSFNMQASNNLIIEEQIRIDYDKYNEIVKSFKKDYTLSLDSYLVVTLFVSFDGSYKEFEENISNNKNISLVIPLSEQTIDIEMDYENLNDSKLIKSNFKKSSEDFIIYVICALFALLDIIFILGIMRLLNKITVTKTIYEKTIIKIMREYNQIIVETKNIPAHESARIIEVKSFEELLDAREMIGKPILYIKINNQKSWFMISNGDEMYKYVLKAVDLEK
jgi:hypothetical protein